MIQTDICYIFLLLLVVHKLAPFPDGEFEAGFIAMIFS